MQNWKTSVAGYIGTGAGVLALIADVLPPKFAMWFMIIGQMANGVGNVLSKDADSN